MPEIHPGHQWRVTVTEYEQGWGQRPCPDETKYFDNLAEAEAYADRQNGGSPEFYWRSTLEQIS